MTEQQQPLKKLHATTTGIELHQTGITKIQQIIPQIHEKTLENKVKSQEDISCMHLQLVKITLNLNLWLLSIIVSNHF